MLIDQLMNTAIYTDLVISSLFVDIVEGNVDSTNYLNAYNELTTDNQELVDKNILKFEFSLLNQVEQDMIIDDLVDNTLIISTDSSLNDYLNTLDLNGLNELESVIETFSNNDITDVMDYINVLDDNELFLFLNSFNNYTPDSIEDMSKNDIIPKIVFNYISNASNIEKQAFFTDIHSLLEHTISRITEETIQPQQKDNDELIVKTLTHALLNGEITPFNTKRFDGTSLAELKSLISDSMQKVTVKTSHELELVNHSQVLVPHDVFSIINVFVVGDSSGDHTIAFDWEVKIEDGIEVLHLSPDSTNFYNKKIRLVYIPHKDSSFKDCPGLDPLNGLVGVQSIDPSATNWIKPSNIIYKPHRIITANETTIDMEFHFTISNIEYINNENGVITYNPNRIIKTSEVITSKLNQCANNNYDSHRIVTIKEPNVINGFDFTNVNIFNPNRIVKCLNNTMDATDLLSYSLNYNYLERIVKTNKDFNSFDFECVNVGFAYNNRIITCKESQEINGDEFVNFNFNERSYPITCKEVQTFDINKSTNKTTINSRIVSSKDAFTIDLDKHSNNNYENISRIVSNNDAQTIDINKSYNNKYKDISRIITCDDAQTIDINKSCNLLYNTSRIVKNSVPQTIELIDTTELTPNVTKIVTCKASTSINFAVSSYMNAKTYFNTIDSNNSNDRTFTTTNVVNIGSEVKSACDDDNTLIIPNPGVKLSELCSKSSGFVLDKTFVCCENQTLFTNVAYTPQHVLVILQGRILPAIDYIANDCKTIELLIPASEGDTVRIMSFQTFDIADTYTKDEINLMMMTAASKTAAPMLSQNKKEIIEGGVVDITIRDFNPNTVYTVSCSDGSVNRVGDRIKYIAPILDIDPEIEDSLIVNVFVKASNNCKSESVPSVSVIKILNKNMGIIDPVTGVMLPDETICVGDTILDKKEMLTVTEMVNELNECEVTGSIVTDSTNNINSEAVILSKGQFVKSEIFEMLDENGDIIPTDSDDSWLAYRPISQHRPYHYNILDEYTSDDGHYYKSDRGTLILNMSVITFNLLISLEFDETLTSSKVVKIVLNQENIILSNSSIVIFDISSYKFQQNILNVFRDNVNLFISHDEDKLDNPIINNNVINVEENVITLDSDSSENLLNNLSSTNDFMNQIFVYNNIQYGVDSYEIIRSMKNEVNQVIPLEDQSGFNRWGYTSTQYKEIVYMIGGYDKDGNVLLDLIEYNLDSHSFRTLNSSMPKDLSGFSMSYRNEKLYIVGGYDNTTQSLNKDLIIYDLKIGLWEIRATGLPGIHKHKVVEYNYNLYIIGGELNEKDSFEFNGLIEYNILNNSYKYIESPGINEEDSLKKFSRINHSVCILNDEIYVMGGNNTNASFNETFYRYSINKDEYTEFNEYLITGDVAVAEAVKRIANPGLCVIDNVIYINGGMDHNGNAVKCLYSFDTIKRMWLNVGGETFVAGEIPDFQDINSNLFGYKDSIYNIFGYDGENVVNGNIFKFDLFLTNIKLINTNFAITDEIKANLISNGIGSIIDGITNTIESMIYDSTIDIVLTKYALIRHEQNRILWKFRNSTDLNQTIEDDVTFFSLCLDLYEEIEEEV